MNDPLAIRQRRANRGFVGLVVVSVLLHVGAIGYVFYRQHRRPSVIDVRNSIPVQLVALGKKRDPNLLPRKVSEPPPPPPDIQGIALDTKTDDSKPSQPTKKKESDQKLSDAAKRMLEGRDHKIDDAMAKLEEREGDPDGDIHGTTTDNTNAALGYQRAIIKTLQSNYALPTTIPASQRRFLNAQVHLFIERDGTISKFEFVEEHSNEMFMSALTALLKSIKLPPPPPSEADTLRDTGIIVIFQP